MKIGIVCPYDWHRPGGVQRHIAALADVLEQRGHRIGIITPSPSMNARDDRLYVLGRRRAVSFNQTRNDVSWASSGSIRALLVQEKFDLLHFHSLWEPFMVFQLFLRADCPRVATFHDTPSDTPTGRLIGAFFRLAAPALLKRLDGAIAVSASPAGYLRETPDKPIRIIPPCVDLSPLLAAEPGKRDEGEPNGDRPLNFLFMGRLDARKGVDVLIEAIGYLYHWGVPVRLRIAGDGTRGPSLRKQAQASPASQWIEFIGAFPEDQKTALLAQADMACFPALYGESFGIVLAEAMAAGRPVIAADNPGYRTVLGERAADCLCPPGDAVALAERIRYFMDHPPLRRELGKWGRAQARRYDCRNWVETFEAFYTEALSRSGRVRQRR
ncbi:MAG: phosphatidylinositol alpha-mannosyltransferase [Candidatus Kentron sp. G]|nr:MAG: phosphatidylinositol alpha-mannosyltransferase [Candidatus Kentron sp. G]VFN00673.1 MAG: phosphatidylinositol alpha-mannosyltransferase [Candidatus Kentron sp. G]VFN02057.1 MAG: phosphatidylinositol alpha-mannosyltransferase [Candidatus Kentron sp. G]